MMFGRKFTSLVSGIILEDAQEDYKNGKRVGQYRVSSRAIYRPDGSYLPFEAVKSFRQDKGSVHVTGCCAGGVMVDRIVFVTDEKSFAFEFDSKRAISKVLEMMQQE